MSLLELFCDVDISTFGDNVAAALPVPSVTLVRGRGAGKGLITAAQAQRVTREIVWLSNHERPHIVLKYQTPCQVYIIPLKSLLN